MDKLEGGGDLQASKEMTGMATNNIPTASLLNSQQKCKEKLANVNQLVLSPLVRL